MSKRIPIKNHHLEIQLITKRSMQALFIMGGLLFLLILRLAYLQIYKHDLYVTLSTKNWLALVPVEPTRGLIYDRKGVLLAENIPVFSLDIIPSQVPHLNATLHALTKIIALTSNDVRLFQKQVKQHRRFDEIPLKFRLTEKEVAVFTENQHRFPGVRIKARLMRHYPYGETFSHVLGYVGRINAQELNQVDATNYSASYYIGKLGIEKFYEKELHGKVGYEEVENDASGKPIRLFKKTAGRPGQTLYLTLDSGLQLVAEKALAGHRGAIVAIQPATGQVLALVSKPGFDPNVFVAGINQKDYQTLQQSPDRPFFNRALRGLYPLASTIKPFMALQALNTAIIDPNEMIPDPGWYEASNHSHRYVDWVRYGHGKVDLSKAILSSCDTYFYDLASKMGIQSIDAILLQFGFGQATGIDLNDELPGIVASPEWKQRVKKTRWYEGDTIISGIGQGFMQATPLQLAVATATLANRGQRFMPYLVFALQTPTHKTTKQAPFPLDKVILNDQAHWDYVIKAMQEVVSSPQGTAHRYGKSSRYSIAAKTGTGQVVSRRGNPNEVDNQNDLPEKLRDHHLFIAFAPVEQPVIAIAVITENSYYTIDVARKIFDYYLAKPEATVNHANRPTETKTEKTNA